jgi:hypothetical protein
MKMGIRQNKPFKGAWGIIHSDYVVSLCAFVEGIYKGVKFI